MKKIRTKILVPFFVMMVILVVALSFLSVRLITGHVKQGMLDLHEDKSKWVHHELESVVQRAQHYDQLLRQLSEEGQLSVTNLPQSILDQDQVKLYWDTKALPPKYRRHYGDLFALSDAKAGVQLYYSLPDTTQGTPLVTLASLIPVSSSSPTFVLMEIPLDFSTLVRGRSSVIQGDYAFLYRVKKGGGVNTHLVAATSLVSGHALLKKQFLNVLAHSKKWDQNQFTGFVRADGKSYDVI